MSLGGGSGYGFAPLLVGDAVYAATPSGTVAKVDLSSGRVLWQTKAAGTLSAGVGSDGRITAVAGTDGTVIAFDDQGREQWRARATSAVNIPPLVGNGVVVVRSSDYRLQAFDEADGELRWSVQRPGPALALRTNIRMIMLDNLIIAGMPNGRMLAVEAGSGDVQWEGTVSQPQGATDLDRISDVVGEPLLRANLLCGASYQGRIACFDLSQGGGMVWEQPFSTHGGMGADNDRLYSANTQDVVHAFSLSDGGAAWRQDALRNRRLTAPVAVPAGVAVADFEGYLHFLSRGDGLLLGRLQLGGGAVVSPPQATPRGIVVQTANGNLVLVNAN